jgi:hypothetical protein
VDNPVTLNTLIIDDFPYKLRDCLEINMGGPKLSQVNDNGVITFVDENNDRNEIVGMGFDFSVGRWRGYIGQLPIHIGN